MGFASKHETKDDAPLVIGSSSTPLIQNPHTMVQLEIEAGKLEALISSGDLCVADLRCLNSESKTCVWRLCLASCTKKKQCQLTD